MRDDQQHGTLDSRSDPPEHLCSVLACPLEVVEDDEERGDPGTAREETRH
jgi:hypothetical protein